MTHYLRSSYPIVIWDADGTLYNSPQVSIRKHQDVARALGLTVPTEDELRGMWHKTWDVIIQDVWGADADRFREAFDQAYYGLTYPPFPGVAELVADLHAQGIVQAVLTNRDAESCARRIHMAGIPLEVFHTIDGIEFRMHHKPHPGAFDRLWSVVGNGARVTDAVYVGDTVGDAAFARAVGCGFIGVCTYVNSRQDFLNFGVHPDNILAEPQLVRKFY